MVPNFALALSFEGIGLLRRIGPSWALIDEVPIDHPDLDAAVLAMRDRAMALDPKAVDIALVIPNEQIRYLDLPDTEEDTDSAIRTALDGATPYPLDQLVWDHARSGGRLQIAAVARDTLDEAESFARDHGFLPLCHLAKAEAGNFDGAVFFGKTQEARRNIDRPARALEIVAATPDAFKPAQPQPKPDPKPEARVDAPEPAPTETPEPEIVPEEPALTQIAEPAAVLEGPAEQEVAVDASAPVDPPIAPTPAPTLTEDDQPDLFAQPSPKDALPEQQEPEPAAPEPVQDMSFADVLDQLDETPDEPAPKLSFTSIRATSAQPVPDAPRLSIDASRFTAYRDEKPAGSPDERASAKAPALRAERTDNDTGAAPKVQPAATSASAAPELGAPSRQSTASVPPAPEPVVAPDKPIVPPQPVPESPTVEAPTAPDITAVGARAVPRADGPSPLVRLAAMRRPSIEGPALARPKTPHALPPQPTSFKPLSPVEKDAPTETRNAARLAAALAATPVDDTETPKKPKAIAPPETATEKDRLTVFGARAKPERRKPRFLALYLTAALILLLLGIGAWSTVFLDDGLARFFGPRDEAETVETATAEAEEIEDLEDAGEELAALDIAPAPQPAVPLTQPAPAPVGRVLTEDEAATLYAATGIWQRTPDAPLTPPSDAVEGVYVASIDPSVQVFDAVALPRAPGSTTTLAPADPGLPPPAGMTFDIDERGLVRATPEGALTPDYLRVYAGQPPVVPPLRGGGATPTPVSNVQPDADEADETAVATPTSPLAAFRPEARPDDIIEQRERATLSGISRQELAAIRPQLRPQTAQEQAEESDPQANATDQAVTASLQPVSRPRNIAAIVERAEELRPTAPVQTAAVAPRTVQPSVPSSASVATSATVRNAIRLNRINLIGVYGTPSNRRALVRMPSGKYLKVKVGDRLDGGRVAAIGESELRYSKSGRNVTLQMPRG
ncbi:hypothetical protein [Sagittula sp. SSi028]|uniref:hypothetical protein n=1 Tax=Sagittula sp. SSi028 TaxID=3400636 RepID=UPI003AF6479C